MEAAPLAFYAAKVIVSTTYSLVNSSILYIWWLKANIFSDPMHGSTGFIIPAIRK